MAVASARSGTIAINWMRLDIPKAETASSPMKPSAAVTAAMPMGLMTFEPAAGKPKRKSLAHMAMFKRQRSVRSLSARKRKAKRTANIAIRAITVAIAAPVIPNSGTTPNPKMKSGASTMFDPAAKVITIAGRTASPDALITAFPTIARARSTKLGYQTRM